MASLVHLMRWLAWHTGAGAAPAPASTGAARITVFTVGARSGRTP